MSSPHLTAPGSYRPLVDHWGAFPKLAAEHMPSPSLLLIDARVAKLHPKVARAAEKAADQVVALRAGERAKSVDSLDRLVRAGLTLPRSGALVCVGGGTLGDLATVAAHLLKRGVRLIHVPSTLLAAVDSSVGGKGALHAGTPPVKNALGVFHYPDACWVCPELFQTLSPRQLREGAIEAWKMVACVSEPLWHQYREQPPSLEHLVRDARALKADVCEKDPYEIEGLRRVLNFGHTFGHVIESVTHFGVSHGDAVGLGMLCALDVGRALGVTDEVVAVEVEEGLHEGPGVLGRKALAKALAKARLPEVDALLAADKKAGAKGELKMVLLRGLGDAPVLPVSGALWRELWPFWIEGKRP